MNALKRFFALALCLVLMVACFTGCHEKGEIAVTVGDIQFTSGDYACALLFADIDAREKVAETLQATAVTGNIDYTKYPIDGVEYTTWVKNKALDTLKLHAAVESLCNKNKVVLAADVQTTYNGYIDTLWSDSYTVSLMEGNGISKETFSDFAYYSYLLDSSFFYNYFNDTNFGFENPLFNHYYGKGGEKAVSDEEINTWLSDTCLLVNRLSVPFDKDKEDANKEKSEKFDAYAAALKDGSKTFEEIYLEFSEIEAEDHKHEEPKEGEIAPLDPHAVLISKEVTGISYSSEYFDVVKEMAIDEVRVIELKDNAGLVLVVKKDLSKDPYYAQQYDSWLRTTIVGDGFINLIKTHANTLPACEVNAKSTDQFKVKKIKYPDVTTY